MQITNSFLYLIFARDIGKTESRGEQTEYGNIYKIKFNYQ